MSFLVRSNCNIFESSSKECYRQLGDLDITRLSEQITWLIALLFQAVAIIYVCLKLNNIIKWQRVNQTSWKNKLFMTNVACLSLLLVQLITMIVAEVYSFSLKEKSISDIEDFQDIYIALWVFSIIILLSIIGQSSLHWMDVLIHSRYYTYLKYLYNFQKVFVIILYVLGPLSILLLFFKVDITFYVVSSMTLAIELIFIISCFQFWRDVEAIYDLSSTFKRHVKTSIIILIIACLLRVIFNICGAAGALQDIHCFDEESKENTNFSGCVLSIFIFLFGATVPIMLISSIFSPHRAPKKLKTFLNSETVNSEYTL
ncbi:hypothetical protein ABPG72_018193 [Tetrahymena utriculariae]